MNFEPIICRPHPALQANNSCSISPLRSMQWWRSCSAWMLNPPEYNILAWQRTDLVTQNWARSRLCIDYTIFASSCSATALDCCDETKLILRDFPQNYSTPENYLQYGIYNMHTGGGRKFCLYGGGGVLIIAREVHMKFLLFNWSSKSLMATGGAATVRNKEMVENVHCDRFLKLF